MPLARPAAIDPIKPIQVKTVKVKLAPTQVATLTSSPGAPASGQIAIADAHQDRASPAIAAPQTDTPPQAKAEPQPAPQPAPTLKSASPQKVGMLGVVPFHENTLLVPEPKREPERDLIGETIREMTPPQSAPRPVVPPAPSLHSGWIIQVGAFDVEREAREKLNAVKAKAAQILGHASPFTEAVVVGEKTLYRARFAGMQKDQAESICRQLKRNDIACMTIKN